MTLSRIHHTGAATPTTLSGSITAGATSLAVASSSGYPSAPFVIKIDAGTTSEEKVLVGSISGTTLSSLTRGYDNTSPTSHSSGAAVEHDLGANVVDDLNDHVYTTSRDDHTQYARTDGTRAVTGSQTFSAGLIVSSGGLTVTAGGLTVSASGAAITGNSTVTGTFTATSTSQATALIATLTGTNGRYVGATSGAPASGTYLAGDFADDPTNQCFWLCVTGGTPGTWNQVGGQTDAAWTNATLSGTWVNSGGGASGGYRMRDGRVYLRGQVKSGTGTIFTLPTGYRPSATLAFAVTGNSAFALVEVASTGVVSLNAGSATAGLNLDSISFDTL